MCNELTSELIIVAFFAFRIVFLHELGHGAFGRVFLARMDADLAYERVVAVKTIKGM